MATSTSSSTDNGGKDTIRTEPLFVLYGSQTGNSEQAAEDFCKVIKEKYTPSYFLQHNLTPVTVEPTCIQLDDFLDYRHAAYTKNIVIFVSSYGVGQAPIGSYKFRSFADELLSLVDGGGDNNNNNYATLLKGLRYAICGLGTFCVCVCVCIWYLYNRFSLSFQKYSFIFFQSILNLTFFLFFFPNYITGDSNYTTYLVNPTTIDKGLTAVGAKRIGEMGKGDANAKKLGNDAQDQVIARWKEELYIPLAKALSTSTSTDAVKDVKDVKEMQADTIPILMKLDKDYTPPKEFRKGISITTVGGIPIVYLILGIIVALIAAALLNLLPVQ
ncbi:MAG: sulfite reductase alpha subunit-like flavoprotein [Bacillariaceae sp.]|jgi:sulfite reductase alpha subunit-like flavoprotein